MNDMPKKIWSWFFMDQKKNEVMKGGWDDLPDRKCTQYIRKDVFDDFVKAADDLANAVSDLPDGPYHSIYADLADYRIAKDKANEDDDT
jgi:hypothetical protein